LFLFGGILILCVGALLLALSMRGPAASRARPDDAAGMYGGQRPDLQEPEFPVGEGPDLEPDERSGCLGMMALTVIMLGLLVLSISFLLG